jgi:hypothetical protein
MDRLIQASITQASLPVDHGFGIGRAGHGCGKAFSKAARTFSEAPHDAALMDLVTKICIAHAFHASANLSSSAFRLVIA